MSARRRRIASAALAAMAALTLAGCSGGSSDQQGQAPATVVPPAASEFWVDPASTAAKQVEQWRQDGRTADATELEKIARQPVAHWIGSEGNTTDETKGIVSQAKAAGRTPVLVAYNIPNRDCGQYSSGGAQDDDQYRSFVGQMAAGIGGTKSVVILEPDALAQTLSKCEGEQGGREALLSGAVKTLKGAGAEVYIDAGNPGFVQDTGQLADGLRKSGIDQAAGFALNVSNFQTNDAVTSYGKKVSDQIGGKKFVIDTSRNGNGSYSGPEQPTWCNPPGRALGTPPTRKTSDPRVAAYLWIKEPGDSDGDCRGSPSAGQFMPDYALGLAKAAKSS
ncbi:glycoside hydrolase family 6 protein [Actinomycetospora endophytica]|uniref:Glucanase n=1 Tax=Actinomycetospora endophytica TaxID=2291215 RepID=A0ABS8P4M1_9PSEU|nr:glycoside hydrolase family 6 protein [Actinomycetospora endophytica]MCD2193054.1 glycoside hydrolase family 6 protein [Actinomycetospora endophytica]